MTDPSSSSSQADSLPSKIHQTPFPAPLPPRRRHREAQIERAYELQRSAAIRGATIWTFIGLSSTFLSHHLFPRFRGQTLAFKAFLVSGFTIFGFVVGADTVLLNHEGAQRSEEDMVRTVARRELGRKGIIASEAEIERWKRETRERLLREREQQQQQQQQGEAQTTAP